MTVDFCLPIKNEALILESSLNKLLTYCEQNNFIFSWRIIGVINGSTDHSVDILKNFKNKYPERIDFIEISEPGRGRALKKCWLLSTADILSYMDCDLAVSLDNLSALIMPLVNKETDLTIGSRLSEGSATQRSIFREFVSHSYNLLSHLLLNHNIADLQCGFKAIRREVFLKIEPQLVDDYWFFDTELVILAKRLGFTIREVPVDWRENRFQNRKSTVKIFHDSLAFIKNLLVFRHRLKKIKKYRENV